MLLHSVHPLRPATPFVRLRPPPVWHQDFAHTYDPGRDLDVDERDIRAEEERPGRVGGGGDFKDF